MLCPEHGEGDPYCQISLVPKTFKSREFRHERGKEIANYVATLSADLATMSRDTGLETLGYLLEMVRLEAESSARPTNGPNGRRS